MKTNIDTGMPLGYTEGRPKGISMANIKTAISIQESLFEKIEQLARDLHVPRSHIFVLAVEDYIHRRENQRLLARINDAYKDEPEISERKRLGQMRSSHRRIVEGEW